MTVNITISDSITQAMRLPSHRVEAELRQELAIALYSQDILSFGKARELAELDKFAFGQLLGQRSIIRHYDQTDLDDDLRYVCHQ